MENKINVIIGLGALVLLLPFLGLPQSIDNFLYVLSGLIFIGIGLLTKLKLKNGDAIRETKTFEENGANIEREDDRQN